MGLFKFKEEKEALAKEPLSNLSNRNIQLEL